MVPLTDRPQMLILSHALQPQLEWLDYTPCPKKPS